jgi:hypothetical protein
MSLLTPPQPPAALSRRPRMQSRAEVVPLRQGEGVIFPSITVQFAVRAAFIGSTCDMVSAVYVRVADTHSASFSTMPLDISSRNIIQTVSLASLGFAHYIHSIKKPRRLT